MEISKVGWVWIVIFQLQFREIYPSCEQNNYYTLNCRFEHLYLPISFKIPEFHQYNYRIIDSLTINNSMIVNLNKNSFQLLIKNVHYITITRSRLANITEDSFTTMFGNVKQINLDHNNLTKIYPVFPPSLLELSLTHNNITWIHNNAFSSSNQLTQLRLDHNRLTKINNTLNFNNVYALSLSHNRIADLEAFQATRLKALNLSFNHLSHLVSEAGEKSVFHSLANLSNLDLSNNKLDTFGKATFNANVELKYLNLSRNSIRELKLRAFDKLAHLVHLNLSRNEISKLDLGAFIGLSSLSALDLSFNRLLVIDTMLFHNTPQLQTLLLHNNFLKHFSADGLLRNTRLLTTISIHDNSIQCSDLYEILHKLNKLQVVKGSESETYSLHGIACSLPATSNPNSLTTGFEDYGEFTTSFVPNTVKKETLEGLVLQNSEIFASFRDFFKNQTESLDSIVSIMKVSEESNQKKILENQRITQEILKSMKIKEENETLFLDVFKNISKENEMIFFDVLKNISKENEMIFFDVLKNISKENEMIFFDVLKNISKENEMIFFNVLKKISENEQSERNHFLKQTKSGQFESDSNNKSNNINNVFNNIFQIIIISLLVLISYLAYNFIKKSKNPNEFKEMERIV